MASSSSTTRIRLSVISLRPHAQFIVQTLRRVSYARFTILRAYILRSQGLAEAATDLFVERGQIVGFAAAHPIAIANHLFVAPSRAGVADVVLQRRPARHRDRKSTRLNSSQIPFL